MSRSLKELEKQLTKIPAGKYLIALSGGADSVALLMMLSDLSAEWQLELEAVHVNHGLREEASDLDEAFSEICADRCRFLCMSAPYSFAGTGMRTQPERPGSIASADGSGKQAQGESFLRTSRPMPRRLF